MRCSKAHKLIGDYLEGALALKECERLQEHLEDCGDCRDLLKDFQGIFDEAKELPKREPSNRVWTAILSGVREAGRETAEHRVHKPKWYETFPFQSRAQNAWAAALALVVVIGGIIIGLRPWKDVSGLSEQDRFTMTKLEEAEKHYKLAIQALSEAVGSEKNGLDPQVAAVFERNLKEIDGAIQECRNAVAKEPNNLNARIYLLGAYKEKVDFLDNVIDVKKKSPSDKGTDRII